MQNFFKKTIAFLKAHPIIATFIYMFVALWVICTAAMFFLDSWTHHGEQTSVPSLKGLTYEDAIRALKQDNFEPVVSDSIFDSTMKPGTVVEQSPTAGANVKPGRTVYLTIVAFNPKMVSVPYFMNTSLRQGRSMFEATGIKKIRVVEVESEYKDLVLGAKFNGVPLNAGQRIPVTAEVTLEVGRGYVDVIEGDEETEAEETASLD